MPEQSERVTKGTLGGWRPGSGRPPGDSERYTVYLHRDVRVVLMRFAATKGLALNPKRRNFWDMTLRELLASQPMPEPAYLALVKRD